MGADFDVVLGAEAHGFLHFEGIAGTRWALYVSKDAADGEVVDGMGQDRTGQDRT